MASEPDRNDELTSTMGNLMSTTSTKSEVSNDSTPTSSTDAFTAAPTPATTSEDPISSTSCEDMNKASGDASAPPGGALAANRPAVHVASCSSFIVTEKDLLEMNISDTSTEKITENVDDIVQDLENLLGEPTASYTYLPKRKIAPSVEADLNIPVNTETSSEPPAVNAEVCEPVMTPESVQNAPSMEEMPKGENEEIPPPESVETSAIEQAAENAEISISKDTPVAELVESHSATPETVLPTVELAENLLEQDNVEPIAEESTLPESVDLLDDSVKPTEPVEEFVAEVAPSVELEDNVMEILREELPQALSAETVASAKDSVHALENAQQENLVPEVDENPREIPLAGEKQEDSVTLPSESESQPTLMEQDTLPLDTEPTTDVPLSASEDSTIENVSELGKTESEGKISDCITLSSTDLDYQQPMDVDEIPEQPMQMQDDNLETLLAVAQLAESTYQLPVEEESQEEQPIEMPVDTTLMDFPTVQPPEELETPQQEESMLVQEAANQEHEQTGKRVEEISLVEDTDSQKEVPIGMGEQETIEKDAEEERIEKDTVEAPIERDAEEEPIDKDAEQQSIEKDAEQQPIESHAEQHPIETHAVQQPIDKQAAQQPIEMQAVQQPIEMQAVQQPIETQAEQQPIEMQAEQKPIKTQAEQPPLDMQAEQQPIQTQAEQEPIQIQDVQQPMEEDLEQQPIEIDLGEKPNEMEVDQKPIEMASEHEQQPQSQTVAEEQIVPELKPKHSPIQSEIALEQENVIQHPSPEIQNETQEQPSASNSVKEPLLINIDEHEQKDCTYSPKVTIKPIKNPEEIETESNKQPLKMTITKQSNTMHSILKIYNPDDTEEEQQPTVPKLIIKPVMPPGEQHSPKRKVFSPTGQRSSSPRITIKPIVKPPEEAAVSPLKITIKPVVKEQKHSPKISIKPIVKPDEEETKVHSPRVTIKPILKPSEEPETVISPRITIKPIKPPENVESCSKAASPKITIKPIVKPADQDQEISEEVKERIVLKINKGTIPEKSEKLAKIKLKFSKEGGHPHIVQERGVKRQCQEDFDQQERSKRQKQQQADAFQLRELLNTTASGSSIITIDDDDEPSIIQSTDSPIVISEESNSDTQPAKDPLGDIPVFELPTVVEVAPPAPRKRGRPRKNPVEVRDEFKDPKDGGLHQQTVAVAESTRPKRSCRGPSVRTTLGMKPRKPRGGGRGRGSKRGMGTRSSPPKTREVKLSATAAKLKAKEDFLAITEQLNKKAEQDQLQESQNSLSTGFESSTLSIISQANESCDRADIVMYEEETRMSAESRAQTPAKQVVLASLPNADLVEESQSSVLSTATTESAKVRKTARLEVQEPEGSILSADQLAEYYWGGSGPYMLQEQVAQFLGIKSFKRKYPNITRRFVDMQERDFIRESGLAGESMCDLGLTAVSSNDILDIMYSDFQDKYEEYCKHQRDRQAKDMTNKQKALSLATMQEKNRVDITLQAVQSAAGWNVNFNKTRREQRKACMDLQTLTVHYPKGKMKQINKPKLGRYPVALVPGQFTDYYREFTPEELNHLPLNTMCYDRLMRNILPEVDCDSQTDGSGSESDSSSSDSDSSFSGSSDGEDCTLCKHSNKKTA